MYKDLGDYSDMVDLMPGHRFLAERPDRDSVRAAAYETLNVPIDAHEDPVGVRTERQWEKDGILGEEISYSVGYGPRTFAWILKPEGQQTPLPSVLALHSHDAMKFYGKEKIAAGPDRPSAAASSLQHRLYGGRAFANELARQGFVVMVNDVFGWGSRRVPFDQIPRRIRELGSTSMTLPRPGGGVAKHQDPVSRYDATAWIHEDLIEKYCAALGTTSAALVSHEDRIALSYLTHRPDTTDRIGCVGLSGGGARAVLLRATAPSLTAAVVVGMMGTFTSLLDHCVITHTWMLFPAGFAKHGDWPDLAACAAPAPLMIQYNDADPFFPLSGELDAHHRITAHYEAAQASDRYVGTFYHGPHKFDITMQRDAFSWLTQQLT